MFQKRKFVASSVWVVLVAIAGCTQSMEAPSDTASRDMKAVSRSGTLPVPAASEDLQGEQDREGRARSVADLQAQLAALQSEQDALRVERDRLAVRLESHQAEGRKRLEQLRAQWRALENNAGASPDDVAARDRFAERARVEMETALMMDQEYRSHLEEAEGKLREMQRKANALREQ